MKKRTPAFNQGSFVTGRCYREDFRLDDFRREDFLLVDFLRDDLRPEDFLGTLAPFFRASERPIAIACLRLLTRPPLPPRPDFSVPFFFRRIADSTLLLAAFPYLRPLDDFFLAAILGSPWNEMWSGSGRENPGVRQAVIEIVETRVGASYQSFGDADACG